MQFFNFQNKILQSLIKPPLEFLFLQYGKCIQFIANLYKCLNYQAYQTTNGNILKGSEIQSLNVFSLGK